MPDKHPTEIIQELDKDIHEIENLVCQQFKILELNKFKLEKLKLRKQSLLNYLNENE
jgi:enoyl reductase-like protein